MNGQMITLRDRQKRKVTAIVKALHYKELKEELSFHCRNMYQRPCPPTDQEGWDRSYADQALLAFLIPLSPPAIAPSSTACPTVWRCKVVTFVQAFHKQEAKR